MSGTAAKVIKTLKGFKGLFIAGAIVIIIILGLFAYSGLWPPLVVVESESMQHSNTTSYIGVIDTGDLVIVKKVTFALGHQDLCGQPQRRLQDVR